MIVNLARSYKQKKEFFINGIDYSRAIATRAYDFSVKHYLKEFVRAIVFEYKIDYKNNDGKILLAYSYKGGNRKDYDYIVDTFEGLVSRKVDRINFIYKVSLVGSIKKLALFFRLYNRFFEKIEKPFFASLLVIQFLNYDEKIKKLINWKKYNLLVTFCDAHGVENIIAQIAKENDTLTATLQHGQYRVLKKEIENADIEAYENFISDYLLAWGKATQDEFIKAGIDGKRVIPVGAIKKFSENKRIINTSVKGVFGVVLDGETYEKSNIKLIKYANVLSEKYGLKYILRLHPKNNLEKYKMYCDKKYHEDSIKSIENEQYAEKVDFSILHMTGVFVELLSINSPLFVMVDECTEDIFKIEKSYFTNSEELCGLYDYILKNKSDFLEAQYKTYRYYNEKGTLASNYNRAIKDILEKE